MDVATAMRYVGGDRELLDELAAMFGNDAPERLTALRAALERRDMATADRTAHSLKGALSIFGAEAGAAIAREIEALADAGRLHEAGELCNALEDAVQAVLQVLRARPWRTEG